MWNNKILKLMITLGKPGDHWALPQGLTWVRRDGFDEFEENSPLEHTPEAILAAECLRELVKGVMGEMSLVAVWKDDNSEGLLALSLVGLDLGKGGKELVVYIPLDY